MDKRISYVKHKFLTCDSFYIEDVRFKRVWHVARKSENKIKVTLMTKGWAPGPDNMRSTIEKNYYKKITYFLESVPNNASCEFNPEDVEELKIISETILKLFEEEV